MTFIEKSTELLNSVSRSPKLEYGKPDVRTSPEVDMARLAHRLSRALAKLQYIQEALDTQPEKENYIVFDRDDAKLILSEETDCI
jgi:hypothetical protein